MYVIHTVLIIIMQIKMIYYVIFEKNILYQFFPIYSLHNILFI